MHTQTIQFDLQLLLSNSTWPESEKATKPERKREMEREKQQHAKHSSVTVQGCAGADSDVFCRAGAAA